MFLWGKRGKSPAPVRGREVTVQKVDRIQVVRNLVTRPSSINDGGRRKLRGGGHGGGTPRAPRGGGGDVQGEDIDKRSAEYIKKVRKMWFHSHKRQPSQ
ncbi:hypothetical protein PR202_gb24930 [Eleusine coracana subsp. coracana]|uniref:Uncharacterized protein n=1 Tax=Eleusine coracana subsp. coracana TaxID=191504 RepID=A0AAV5FMM7_ELECO|nr:hypothetical protein PR202_gb24930 [Eleusine coracana subsp. coracana]